METLIFIALLNGVVISLTRVINGHLSTFIGALRASLWNHLVGFVFLSLMVVALYWQPLSQFAWSQIPVYAWLSGVYGALFVASSSYVFPKMGALNASVIIIGGQILSAVLLDVFEPRSGNLQLQLLGVAFITFGIIISTFEKTHRDK